MSMLIDDGGILTTVQDAGRFGFEQFGVSPSGPMDHKAMHVANLLVDNAIGESCLECTFKGPSIRFDSPAVLALTGADCQPTLNGRPVQMYRAFSVGSGDVLKTGFVRNGCRTYIAVAGGIKVPVLMNSKCTMVGKSFGGLEGRRLKKGDVLELEKNIAALPNMAQRSVSPESYNDGVREVRVVLGPQDDIFEDEGLSTFLNSTYTVGREFDRQGYRLEGQTIKHKGDGNIISDGIVNGSIQVPGAGLPIVMLAEHQTVGGYTKIATVIHTDLPIFGQCKAGDRIRFKTVSVDEAQELYIRYYEELDALKERLAASVQPQAPMPENASLPARTAAKCRGAMDMIVTVNGRTYTVRVEEMEA